MNYAQTLLTTLGFLFTVSMTGCGGYSFESRGNTWKKEGVQRVFISTLENKTLKTGVEVPFAAALMREFSRGNRIKLVGKEHEADAILEAAVEIVDTRSFSQATVAQISPNDPKAQELSDFAVTSEYIVSASMSVQLRRVRDSKQLWSQSFSRSKIFPGSNKFGLQGSTSMIINGSQEQLALSEIAQFLASDAHDAMFEAF